MGRKNKLKKFADLLTFPNVYENFDLTTNELIGIGGRQVKLKGKWRANHFKNNHPICLELACGGGEYALALARRRVDHNFIGVDIKGNRIWKGARLALQEGIGNVAFLRTRIENLPLFFDPAEVDEMWITFPDPFPRKSKVNKRLTSKRFLDSYSNFLRNEAKVHLKTDDLNLFEFSKASIIDHLQYHLLQSIEDIYAGNYDEILTIKTKYERRHLEEGKKITYLEFQFFESPK